MRFYKELVVESGVDIAGYHLPELKKKGELFKLLVDISKFEIDKLLKQHPEFKFSKIKMTMFYADYFVRNKVGMFYIFKSESD